MIPPAPVPPTFWQQVCNPLAQQKYGAELLAYMTATGVITPDVRNHFVKWFTYFAIVMLVFTLAELSCSFAASRRMEEQIDRTYRQPNFERPSYPSGY